MFLRNSKVLSFIFLLVWLAWFGTSTVCLANNHHVCCPTQSADWHMDAAHSAAQMVRWQLNDLAFPLANLFLLTDIETSYIDRHPLVSFRQIAPPYFLLTKINNQINAPPQA
jgi:hypothetical protein